MYNEKLAIFVSRVSQLEFLEKNLINKVCRRRGCEYLCEESRSAHFHLHSLKMSAEEEEHDSAGSLDSSSQDALSESAETSFRLPSLSLSTQLVSNLERHGLTVPTEVQLQVIPKIRDERGKDLCVNAPTGSGKTLAYALPIVEVSAS